MKLDLMKAGMPDDAKSEKEAHLAAASQGKGSQLKQTFNAWRQDTNFVLADAVYEGDMGKLQLLKTCGFNVTDKKGKVHSSGGGRRLTGVFREFIQEETTLQGFIW